MTKTLRIGIGIALLFGLAACGRTTTAGGTQHPTGARELILRISTGGGFVMPGTDQIALPDFSLMGDGRVIYGGPQIEIYPGPALPNVLSRTVTEAGIQTILDAARDAGLLGADAHYDHPGIADAPTTTFTVNADGVRHVVSAYALGSDDGGMANPDADKRAKLQAFRERASNLSSWLPAGSLGEEEPFDFDALRIVVRPAFASDGDVKPNEIVWPLATPLRSFGSELVENTRCGVIDGEDARTVTAKARNATQITRWLDGGDAYQLSFRPQLPDETGCA